MNNRIVLLVGSGSENAAGLANDYSKAHNITFNGVLDEHTTIQSGSYHTSIYDFNFNKLLQVIKSNVDKIVCLGSQVEDYANEYDFYLTRQFLSECSIASEIEYLNPLLENKFARVLHENKSLCLHPWMSLYQKNNKVFSCCFQHRLPFAAKDYNVDVVKQKMLNNDFPEQCSFCYDLEKYNGLSPRLVFSHEWSQRQNIKSLADLKNINGTKFFDFRLDNTCNLQCRTCSPTESNLIADEYFKIGLISNKPATESILLDSDRLKTGERFYFAGGEPLWHKDFLSTLKQFEELGLLNAEIIINTNAANIPKSVIEQLKKFKNLQFVVSLDGIENQATYIRWPVSWEKFVKNVEIITSLSPRVMFNTVISIYNVSDCYKIFEWVEKMHPDKKINIAILTEPLVLQPKYFPDKEKIFLEIEKIKTLNLYKTSRLFSDNIKALEKQILDQEIDLDMLTKFFEFNDKLDISRNYKLGDHIPELEKCRNLITNQI